MTLSNKELEAKHIESNEILLLKLENIREVEKELAIKQDELISLKASIQELNEKIDTLIKKKESQSQEINQNTITIQSQFTEIEKLNLENNSVLEEIKKQNNSINRLTRTKNGLSEEINKLKTEKTNLDKSFELLSQSIAEATLHEKELLLKNQETFDLLQNLKKEEKDQFLLTQQSKKQREKIVFELDNLTKQIEEQENIIKKKKEAIKQYDSAIILKETQLEHITNETNEKLAIVQEAENRLSAKIQNFDIRIKQAKADKLIADSISVL